MRQRQVPSHRELQILRVLWERGSCTVRDVLDRLPDGAEVEYNTVGKLLQIMLEKGLVSRDESSRAHRYEAMVDRAPMQGQLVRDFLDRAFGGSARELVLRALKQEDVTEKDREEIRRVLRETERA